MRRLHIILLMAILMLAGTIASAQSLDLQGNADCEGWGVMATITFPDDVFFTALSYSVVLTDQAGAEVARVDWSGEVSRFEDPQMVKFYDGPWDQELEGAFAADFLFQFLGEEATLHFDLVCGEPSEPEVEPCHHTFRYWRKHPDEWPVDELEIGGRTFTKAQLVRKLHRGLRFHPSISVARHLVATKLNLASGTDPSILPTVEAADEYLAARWTSWRCRGNRSEVRQLRRALVQYNNLPCDAPVLGFDGGQLQMDKTYAEEPMTFSGLKAMYR